MSIVIVISMLAFGISLIALWLTSDIVKKVDAQNEKFVRAHMATVRDELRSMEKDLEKTARMVKTQHEGQAALDGRLNEHAKLFAELRDRIVALAQQLENLDQSIPARFRNRLVKPAAKDAAKTATGKPSIQ